MTTLAAPRALRGPVRAMARPARPAAEIAAVREASQRLTAETGERSTFKLAEKIASRVIARLRAEIEQVADDPFVAALSELEQKYAPSPFVRLATCPEIDTVSEFISCRIVRLQARGGRYLTAAQQQSELQVILDEVTTKLTGRYCKHLRR